LGRYHSFDPSPKPPLAPPPSGACDAHFHVFGPRSRYPVLPGIEHDMPAADVAALKTLHQRLGLERGVICASTVNGSNHAVVLDALKALGSGYRACALHTVFDEQPESYVQTLHDAGVRGARFNLLRMLGRVPEPARIRRSIARIRELGWYCKVQPDYHEPLQSLAFFEDVDTPVIIDHLGRAATPQGEVFDTLLSLLEKGNFWVLLSNGYKVSKAGYPWDDVIPVIRALIEAAPERVLWGSDWPHTFHETPPPNDGDLYNLLHRATSETERRQILVENPAELFGW
jgi:predicted TIM-barrel fold metal-dependent hydrolase